MQPDRLTELLEELRTSRYRATVLWEIGELGPAARPALPHIIDMLDEDDRLVRQHAVRALKSVLGTEVDHQAPAAAPAGASPPPRWTQKYPDVSLRKKFYLGCQEYLSYAAFYAAVGAVLWLVMKFFKAL